MTLWMVQNVSVAGVLVLVSRSLPRSSTCYLSWLVVQCALHNGIRR